MTPAPAIQGRIHRVLAPQIAATAPELVGTPTTGDADVAAAFEAPPTALRPQRVLARVATVNSPDRIELTRATLTGHTIAVSLELRAFEGILGGNLQATAVLDVDVSALPAGTYDLAVTTRRLGFQHPDRPDLATPRDTESRRWSFTVL